MEPERLVPLREVGKILGNISVKTVRRKIAAGELPRPVRIGRIPMLCLSELAAAIEKLKAQRNQGAHT